MRRFLELHAAARGPFDDARKEAERALTAGGAFLLPPRPSSPANVLSFEASLEVMEQLAGALTAQGVHLTEASRRVLGAWIRTGLGPGSDTVTGTLILDP